MKKLILIISLSLLCTFALQNVSAAQDAAEETHAFKWIYENVGLHFEESNMPFIRRLSDNMDLSGANLYGVKIKDCKLENVDFSRSAIVNGDFSHTTFIRCNFSKARIDNVKTDEETVFIDCNFEDAVVFHFDFAKFSKEDYPKLLKTKETLDREAVEIDSRKYAYYPDVFFTPIDPNKDFTDIKISKTNVGLSKKQFQQTKNYQSGLINNVNISGVYNCETRQFDALDYSELDLSNAIVADSMFLYVDFKNANFEDAKLINVDLSKTKNLTADQIKSTWNWKNNAMDWFPKSTLDHFKNELGLDWAERIAE